MLQEVVEEQERANSIDNVMWSSEDEVAYNASGLLAVLDCSGCLEYEQRRPSWSWRIGVAPFEPRLLRGDGTEGFFQPSFQRPDITGIVYILVDFARLLSFILDVRSQRGMVESEPGPSIA